MNENYTGCWTALVTPFTDDIVVDWGQLRQNVEFQIEQGLTGLLPMGTTGESATVTHDEHAKIIEKVTEWSSGRVKILAGTGSNSTEEAIQETRLANEVGVDAILLVDCYYNKPSSMELRREYYGALAEKFPDLDIIPYVIPGRSVTVLAPEDLAILTAKYSNFVAVKEATGDFERMKRTRELVPEDFNILSGDDPNTLKMMTEANIHAAGVVSVISNITPAPIEEYTRLILNGKVDDAKKIEAGLKPLFGIVGVTTDEEVILPDGSKSTVTYKFPNPVPVKTMMNGLGMQDSPCKKPMGKLTKNGVNIVRNTLRNIWNKNPELLEPISGFYDVDIVERLEGDEYWNRLSY